MGALDQILRRDTTGAQALATARQNGREIEAHRTRLDELETLVEKLDQTTASFVRLVDQRLTEIERAQQRIDARLASVGSSPQQALQLRQPTPKTDAPTPKRTGLRALVRDAVLRAGKPITRSDIAAIAKTGGFTSANGLDNVLGYLVADQSIRRIGVGLYVNPALEFDPCKYGTRPSRVRAGLRALGGRGATFAIAEQTGLAQPDACAALCAITEAGQARRLATGYYELTPEGDADA